MVFTFDFVVWGGSSSLADGFTLAIFDANVDAPAAGGYGGSLGYAQHSGQSGTGLDGGIVGFGFDTFGNFSNPTEGRIDGPGETKNAIAIRGSMGDTRYDGYKYLTGTESLESFSTGSAADRSDATAHSVRITIPTDKQVTIEWMTEGDEGYTTLIDYACTLDCPTNVMFGFTGGTGGYSSNQEIRNLSVVSVPEPVCMMLILFAGVIGLWVRRRFMI